MSGNKIITPFMLVLSLSLICSPCEAGQVNDKDDYLQAGSMSEFEVQKKKRQSVSTSDFSITETDNVLFLVDTSSSMNVAYDGQQSKFEMEKELLRKSVTIFPRAINCGLKVYGINPVKDNGEGSSKVLIPISKDGKKMILQQLNNITANGYPSSIAVSLDESISGELSNIVGNNLIVIFFNGDDNFSSKSLAKYLKSNEIPGKLILLDMSKKRKSTEHSKKMRKKFARITNRFPDTEIELERVTQEKQGQYYNSRNVDDFLREIKKIKG